jgi:hypothetical protein
MAKYYYHHDHTFPSPPHITQPNPQNPNGGLGGFWGYVNIDYFNFSLEKGFFLFYFYFFLILLYVRSFLFNDD